MLNQTKWWQYLLVLLVLVAGTLYALPNLFGNAPGIQIRGARGFAVDSTTLARVEAILDEAEITAAAYQMDASGVKIRFAGIAEQLQAKQILEAQLDNNYAVALTLLSAAPSWLTARGLLPMYLGLDLRGGVHFLLAVDIPNAISRARERYQVNIKTELRENKLRYRNVASSTDSKLGAQLEITIRNPQQREQAYTVLRESFPELIISTDPTRDDVILARLSEDEVDNIRDFAMQQNLTALRNRIDQLGVAEPIVQQQGPERIVIQLPGVQDTARAKAILGRAATLEMRLVDESNNASSVETGQAPPGARLYKFRDGRSILLKNRVIYSGDNVADAAASLDPQSGSPIVSITLDAAGATINSRITGDNVGNRMAVVYLELVSADKKDANGDLILDDDGRPERTTKRIEEVLTAPVIRDQLGKRFQIEGIGTVDEARDLALMLRAGALAAPVQIIEERTVGPSLGQANITQGVRSIITGFVLVLLFMLIYYRVFGFASIIALSLNLVLIVAVLSLLQATLTLPGVAGVVLTVGMAVDANVLIFERIREEIRNRNSPHNSIHLGYDRALSTIIDANITTLIAAFVLFSFGTGPIKGFAVTLSIGILTSMFTAIVVTRMIINAYYGRRTINRLAI